MANNNTNGKTKEELEALLDETKKLLEDFSMPANQEGMPAYHSQRSAYYKTLEKLYLKLGMEEAAQLAALAAESELKYAASWDKSLSGNLSNNGAEGGGRKRKSRKSRKRRTSKK